MKTLNTLIASALVVAAGATAASASNIYSSNVEATSSQFIIDTVVADGPAPLSLSDSSNGERGALLDTVDLRAGLTSDVKLDANTSVLHGVQAELTVGGIVADVQAFDIES